MSRATRGVRLVAALVTLLAGACARPGGDDTAPSSNDTAASAEHQPMPIPSAARLCDGCERICDGSPLSHDAEMLDPSTKRFMPRELRSVSTAAAMDMAVALQAAYRKHSSGNFGEAYRAAEEQVVALAKKNPDDQLATSSEIDSLKRLQAALYADAAIGLQELSAAAPPPRWAAVYHANKAEIENLIQQVTTEALISTKAQRAAVCEVLSAYGRE